MNRHSEQGSALLMSTFAIGALSVMVIGFLLFSTSETQIAQYQQFSHQALYLAHAGIEDAIAQLRQDYTWNSGFTSVQLPSGSGNTYTVTVTNLAPTVTMNATAVVNGTYTSSVDVILSVSMPPDTAPYDVRVDEWREN